MQSVSSRIWTRVAVSISYDDNHYTTEINSCCSIIFSNQIKTKKEYIITCLVISSHMGPMYIEIPWFGFFVKWHINLYGTFNAKAISVEEQKWYQLIHRWGDKGFHIFPKGMSLKVNVIARLEFELANYDIAAQHFIHFSPDTSPYYSM